MKNMSVILIVLLYDYLHISIQVEIFKNETVLLLDIQ